MKYLILSFLFLSSCAHVWEKDSPLGDNKYFITCDGNGYSTTGDAAQCVVRAADRICSAQGKQFKFLDAKTEDQFRVGVNLANGSAVPYSAPESAAAVQCYGTKPTPILNTSSNSASDP